MTPPFFRRRPVPAAPPPGHVPQQLPDALRLVDECERALSALAHPSTIGRYDSPDTRARLMSAACHAKTAVGQIRHVLDTAPGARP